MAQSRDRLIKQLRILQSQFPEFADILEYVIETIEEGDIDIEQEDEDW